MLHQVTALRRKLAEAEAAAAGAQAGQARLRERCEAAESAAEEARRSAKAAKEEAAAAAQGFEVGCCRGSVSWEFTCGFWKHVPRRYCASYLSI
jgi:hypothetical protein